MFAFIDKTLFERCYRTSFIGQDETNLKVAFKMTIYENDMEKMQYQVYK